MKYEDIIEADYRDLMALPEKEIYDIVTVMIKHYREVGFPYFELDKNKIQKEYNILKKADPSKTELPNNELQQSMWGLNTCNTFHPEMYSTKCRDSKSPMDIFLDDDLLRVAITKRIKYNDRKLSPSCIRRSLTAFGGQAVSNFRPTIAKWVYEKYCPDGGKVLDPCLGYGGRLMGAFCSHIGLYIGTDPNTDAFLGNVNLYRNLKEVAGDNKFPEMKIENIPFENFQTSEQFDLVFTSPPYFNIEKYSDDKSQSYVRYPEYEQWVDGFLKVLIKNSFSFLKHGGHLVLNVGKPIDQDTFNIGSDIFKQEPETYFMRLSKLLGMGNKGSVSHKTEPIFIWRKT